MYRFIRVIDPKTAAVDNVEMDDHQTLEPEQDIVELGRPVKPDAWADNFAPERVFPVVLAEKIRILGA